MIDLAALAILALRGRHGWKRGTLLMLLSLAGLFAGYVGAALLFRPIGNYLSDTFHMSPFIALPLAGLFVMAAITGGIRMARVTVERRRGLARQEGRAPSLIDSAGGAVVGAVWALGLVLIAAWALMGLHGLLRVGPDISHSITGRVTSSVARSVTYAVTKRRTGNTLVASMLALSLGQPGTGVDMVSSLMNNQNVRGLWTDSTVRRALASGDVNALQRHPALRALAGDTQFVHTAALLGLGTTGLSGVPGGEQLAANLVTQVGPVIRSMQALTHDPEMRRLMNSPRLKRALDQGNLSAVVQSPEFHRIAARFLDALKNPEPVERGTGDGGRGTEKASRSR